MTILESMIGVNVLVLVGDTKLLGKIIDVYGGITVSGMDDDVYFQITGGVDENGYLNPVGGRFK